MIASDEASRSGALPFPVVDHHVHGTLLSHIFSATAASEGLGNPVARAS